MKLRISAELRPELCRYQMVCDICSDGHESVVKAIRKKYGDEMADQFDKNSDIEDMIDYKLRSEVCL